MLVGTGLAYQLEKDYSVKLIERDQERATELAERLHDTIVFYGDASDQELLVKERIEQIDAFIAVTNDDEANIMSAMLTKWMGAKKGIGTYPAARLCGSGAGQRYRYLYFFTAGHDIRAAGACTQGRHRQRLLADVEEWRRRLRPSHTAMRAPRGWLAAISTPSTCRPGTIIGATVRSDELIIANRNSRIEQGDHVIMFLTDKSLSAMSVQSLFSLSIDTSKAYSEEYPYDKSFILC